ncbi:MAG: SPOR domain-containing protein [Fidelibacterota bacterium]
MNRSIKYFLLCTVFFLIFGCTSKKDVFVGDTVDIEDYKRPANVVRYEWAFDTKPPVSRLDPRDFIPSNYHPNVTFIPDVPGRYTVRLTMIDREGNVTHKNFIFEAEAQPDYLADIEKKKQAEKETEEKKVEKKSPPPPKIVEVPKVVEKVILKKETITKIPNEWKKAPQPGESLEDIEQEPAYITKSSTEIIEEDGGSTKKVSETSEKTADKKKEIPSEAKYTLQVSSSTVKSYAEEFRDKLLDRGYDAFIQTAVVEGVKRYRIRVGYYSTYNDAKNARLKMLDKTEFEPWIDRIR